MNEKKTFLITPGQILFLPGVPDHHDHRNHPVLVVSADIMARKYGVLTVCGAQHVLRSVLILPDYLIPRAKSNGEIPPQWQPSQRLFAHLS